VTWIVDTCVLLDVRLNDAMFGRASATCLAHLLPKGLAITSTTFVELAPAFRGDSALLEAFLDQVGVAHQALPGSVQGLTPAWEADDTAHAFGAWHRHVLARRSSGGTIPRRPFIAAGIPDRHFFARVTAPRKATRYLFTTTTIAEHYLIDRCMYVMFLHASRLPDIRDFRPGADPGAAVGPAGASSVTRSAGALGGDRWRSPVAPRAAGLKKTLAMRAPG